MLNHQIGDPQHPFNEVMYEIGLRLSQSAVDSNISEGLVQLPKSWLRPGQSSGRLIQVTCVACPSGNDFSGSPQAVLAVHAVGIGGMAQDQTSKIDWMRSNGLYFIQGLEMSPRQPTTST